MLRYQTNRKLYLRAELLVPLIHKSHGKQMEYNLFTMQWKGVKQVLVVKVSVLQPSLIHGLINHKLVIHKLVNHT